jgi:hypothetical protein
MRRTPFVYAAFVLAALTASAVLVRSCASGPYRRAIAQLHKSEQEFQRARTVFLMGSGDPAPALLECALDSRSPGMVRGRALRVLSELSRQQPLRDQVRPLVRLVNGSDRNTVLEVLRTLEAAQCQGGMDTVAALMRETDDDSVFQGCFRALRSAMTPVISHADSAISAGNDSIVRLCLAQGETLVGGKGPLFRKVGAYLQHKDDTATAVNLELRASPLGPLWAVGPFPNNSLNAFVQDFGPESAGFSRDDTWQTGRGERVGWVRLSHTNRDGFYDFNSVYSGPCCRLCYVSATLDVPSERDALVLLSHGEPARAWLNDSLMYSSLYYGASFGDDFCVRARLREGPNRLLVKAVQDLSGWILMVRVTDLYGESMPDVRVVAEP